MHFRVDRRSRSLSATLLLSALLPLGCGPAADGAAPEVDEPGQAASIEPLDLEVLAAYLPERVLDLPRRADEVNLAAGRTEGGRSFPAEASVVYGSGAREAKVAIADMAGTGAYLEGQKELFQLQLSGEVPASEGAVEARRLDDGTIVVTRVGANAFQAPVELLVADRFRVTITLRSDGSAASADQESVDRLVALYESAPLGRLAAASREPLAAADWLDGPSEPATALADLEVGSCDEVLPAATVGRICGASDVEVRPTPGMEEGGSCNRRYVAGSGGSGLVFMLTRYGGASGVSQASAAAALGDEPGDYAVEHDLLPDLGDGGSRVHDSSGNIPDAYRVRFSLGPVLVELNTTDSPLDQPDQKLCTDLEALTRVGEAIDVNLRGDG